MKCPHCGAQIGLEEKYCPFCGLPNEFARKHQEDMDRYEQEFQQTQSEVYQKTRERFKFCVNRKTDIRYVISYRGQNLFFRVLSLFVL